MTGEQHDPMHSHHDLRGERMSRQRRRAAERACRKMPVCPGVIAENTEEWRQFALTEAHEILPDIPDTFVMLRVYALQEGLGVLHNLGWSDEQLHQLLEHAGTLSPDPHVVVCMRLPHGYTPEDLGRG